jgi:hypothetical protein
VMKERVMSMPVGIWQSRFYWATIYQVEEETR